VCHGYQQKKQQKNDIFYVGIHMVWMIILKQRSNRGIAVGAAVDNLPRHQHPFTPPQLITPLWLVDTGLGMPRRRWEKGSTPKKNTPHHNAQNAVRNANKHKH
jgi:hypothetical protein